MKTSTKFVLVLSLLVLVAGGVWAYSVTARRPSITFPNVTYQSPCGTPPVNSTRVDLSDAPVSTLTIYHTSIADNNPQPTAAVSYYTDASAGCRYTCLAGHTWTNGYCVPLRGCPHGEDITIGGITIAACNVGATALYAGTNAAANYGHFFQRGNNYGFPNAGTIASVVTTTVNTSAN